MEAPVLTIEGEAYVFVKTRNHMPISIYKGKESYLRIGPKELIQQEIGYHKSLLEFGFPIPKIISEGEYLDSHYFTETSFGDAHFGQIFRSNCIDLMVLDSDFSKLLNVVKIFTHAQLQTANVQPFAFETFRELIHTDTLIKELPRLQVETREAMRRIENHTKDLPSVLTHGDFNPFNIFEKGVIDWESGSYAPMGYDLVTNISQTFFFPLGGDYEFTAACRYTEKQIDTYWQQLDTICADAGIPPISDYRNDFILCRSIWSVVRMDRWPKIQAWRYQQFEALIKTYLSGGDLTKFLSHY